MQSILKILWSLLLVVPLNAQPLYPVKIDSKWGLINAEGEVVVEPIYELIGEFDRFGLAVMQKNHFVGLLNREGKEVISAQYKELKVLDSTLVAVVENKDWKVMDHFGRTVVPEGYEEIEVWNQDYIAFRKNGYWGIVNQIGQLLVQAAYDEVLLEQGRYFIIRKGEYIGLVSMQGRLILDCNSTEVKSFNESLIFFRQNERWGVVSAGGQILLQPQYDLYSKLSDEFIKLRIEQQNYLFSTQAGRIIAKGHDDYFAFSSDKVITKKGTKIGLMSATGAILLPEEYLDIQPYMDNYYRVNFQNRWGVLNPEGKMVIPFEYDYIAPLRGPVCLVKNNGSLGVANVKGKEIVATIYDRIVFGDHTIKAYLKERSDSDKESLAIFRFDEEGQLKGQDEFDAHYTIKIGADEEKEALTQDDHIYQLEKYEWFFDPMKGRWGLRRLADGGIQIEPVFHYIMTVKDLGFTLVGMEKKSFFDFERTTFRFDVAYGLVNNDLGMLITKVEFLDLRLEDFKSGLPLARCMFTNGTFGLVNREGLIEAKDLAYIGTFNDGLARVSRSGRISGSMGQDMGLGKLSVFLEDILAAGYMVDYTSYDRLFRHQANVSCESCSWGYIDTLGNTRVQPQYSFAQDFVNEVGIVKKNGKWGAVSMWGKELIPCRYDELHFLENTDNKILRLYINKPKYGLIDSSGKLTVRTEYDEIGLFREGRLAVKRNGLWGYVNVDGVEVIPCRFEEVRPFSEGLAAVRIGRYWGFVDRLGELVIDLQYLKVGDFSEGVVLAYDGQKAGYLKADNQWHIQPQFDQAFDYYRGVARVVVEGEYGLIDTSGRYIEKPRYIKIAPFDAHGLSIVTYGNQQVKYGVINLEGQMITGSAYREILSFSEGLAVVKDKESYGYIDTSGKVVIPLVFSKASSFSEGLAAVRKDGACGYINQTGNPVVSYQFTKCMDYEDGRAVVYKGIRKAGLVDQNGNMILEPSVNRLIKFSEGRGLVRDRQYRFYYITESAKMYDGFYEKASAFKNGVALVKEEGKWGIINQRGLTIIAPKYDKIEDFKNGYAKVRIHGFNGLSNLKGELIVQPNYEYISYAGNGIFRVEQGDEVGYFNSDGDWLWELSN
jgi:hypothetical protein